MHLRLRVDKTTSVIDMVNHIGQRLKETFPREDGYEISVEQDHMKIFPYINFKRGLRTGGTIVFEKPENDPWTLVVKLQSEPALITIAAVAMLLMLTMLGAIVGLAAHLLDWLPGLGWPVVGLMFGGGCAGFILSIIVVIPMVFIGKHLLASGQWPTEDDADLIERLVQEFDDQTPRE